MSATHPKTDNTTLEHTSALEAPGILKTTGLGLTFGGGASVLTDVSFSLKPRERVGIIGPNGSGKTTLFNCLSGFLTPTTGKIFLKGQDVTRHTPHLRARGGLGRTFQNFGLFREMTVGDNIKTALESRSACQQQDPPLPVLEYLNMARIADKISAKAGSLSGGQMRLLEIVRALASGAELFLLDEPTAGVSPKMRGELNTLLETLGELGKTVLIIEHDVNFLYRLCDRILVLNEGRLLLDGSPDEVRRHPLLQEIYFGASEEGSHRVAAG